MANQRPIRRAPFPRFRRRKRRPQRWIEGNSGISATEDPCTVQGSLIECVPDTPVRVLLDGDQDWEWADRSEVVVDRIVGTLSFRFFMDASGGSTLPPFMIRFGILALEETEDTYPTIDLYDRESLEEYQWMWIDQFTITPGKDAALQFDDPAVPTTVYILGSKDEKIDVATRRKLGKKDRVVLYSQFHFMGGSESATRSMQVIPLLRCIIQS